MPWRLGREQVASARRNLARRVLALRSGDIGIDGYSFEGDAVQVNRSEGVWRNVVDNFETALRRASKGTDMIVAFTFTRDAEEERGRAENGEKFRIILLTVKDLLRTDRDLPQTTAERSPEEERHGLQI